MALSFSWMPLKVITHPLAIRLNPQGLSILTKAFLRCFRAFLKIALMSQNTLWGTCLRIACSQRGEFLSRWNAEGREPKSLSFLRPGICHEICPGGFHFELVKMKHLHFKTVSLLFSQISLYLQTLPITLIPVFNQVIIAQLFILNNILPIS